MYPLPTALYQLADQVAGCAVTVRESTHHAATTAGVDWQSTAAQAYRDRLGDAVNSAGRSATSIEDLAASIRAHAANVQLTLERIAAARAFLTSQLGQLEHELGSLMSRGAHALSELGDRLQDGAHAAGHAAAHRAQELQHQVESMRWQINGMNSDNPLLLDLAAQHGWRG